MTPTPDPDDEVQARPSAPYHVHVPPELKVEPFAMKRPKVTTAPVERQAPPATRPEGLADGLTPGGQAPPAARQSQSEETTQGATIVTATPRRAAYEPSPTAEPTGEPRSTAEPRTATAGKSQM